MASIPHGTTIKAQGVVPTTTTKGVPDFSKIVANITPFSIKTNQPVSQLNSQKAERTGTLRLPQDLTAFIKAETINQDILNNPNLVLSKANKGKVINNTTTIQISTRPKDPQLGGGTANIDFLVGAKPNAQGAQVDGKTAPAESTTGPNAQAVQVDATF
ncbi:MAG: hypothetical protein LQ351_007554 [Letrouitia transgressa]|nr:MAG: hypothetical protein LQ351_007554 [Letrouitia transgressa]